MPPAVSLAKLDVGTRAAVNIGKEQISIDELRELWRVNEPVLVLDVRTERSIEESDTQAKGAIRLVPEHVVERAKELSLPKDAWLIAYCA
jgi:rhodanese-related sulfurtransferase